MPEASATQAPTSSRAKTGAKAAAGAKGAVGTKIAAPEAPVLGASRKVKLDGVAFGAGFNEPLVHQCVRAEQAARRRGTAATKTRGMVSGGGAKPWRQKGTGRARAGSSRSPIWTGGGTVFGPQPRSYTFKINRKERLSALRSALSLHAGRGSIAVLDTSAFSAPKTGQAADLLDDWTPLGAPAALAPALVVLGAEERDAALSFRNLPRVAVLTPENVGVADLLGAASLLVSQTALHALVARAGGSEGVKANSSEAGSPSAAKAQKSTPATKPAKTDAPVAVQEPAASGEESSEAGEDKA